MSWLIRKGYAEFLTAGNRFILTADGFKWLISENSVIQPIPTKDYPAFNKQDIEQAQKILNQHRMPNYIDNDLFMKYQAQVYESLNGLRKAVALLNEKCQEIQHEMRKHTTSQQSAEEAPLSEKVNLGPYVFERKMLSKSSQVRAALSKVYNILEKDKVVTISFNTPIDKGKVRHFIDELVLLQGEHYKCWVQPVENLNPPESTEQLLVLVAKDPGQTQTLRANELVPNFE